MNKKDFYNNTYLGNLLNGISSFINCLLGYSVDISMSARIGKGKIDRIRVYVFLAAIIDFTFKPIEGNDHCEKAYYKDPQENFSKNYLGWLGVALTCIVIPLGCLVLFPLFWGYYVINQLF